MNFRHENCNSLHRYYLTYYFLSFIKIVNSDIQMCYKRLSTVTHTCYVALSVGIAIFFIHSFFTVGFKIHTKHYIGLYSVQGLRQPPTKTPFCFFLCFFLNICCSEAFRKLFTSLPETKEANNTANVASNNVIRTKEQKSGANHVNSSW